MRSHPSLWPQIETEWPQTTGPIAHNESDRLDEDCAKIVEGLERDGAIATSLEALSLPGSEEMFEDAAELMIEMAARSAKAGDAARSIQGASVDDLLCRPRMFRWGLHSKIVDIVEAYLGQACAYDGVEYHYSKADGREVSTRCWHRDREDLRQVKIIIYVNDVDQHGGPFEIVHPSVQASLDEQLSWRYAIVNDAKLKSAIGACGSPDGIRSFPGARGTVLFVDTARCHHHGKPPVQRDRAAVFYSYFRRAPAHPFCCERSPVRRDKLVEIAGSLGARERRCVLWRDALPLSKRLIPRNRLTV